MDARQMDDLHRDSPQMDVQEVTSSATQQASPSSEAMRVSKLAEFPNEVLLEIFLYVMRIQTSKVLAWFWQTRKDPGSTRAVHPYELITQGFGWQNLFNTCGRWRDVALKCLELRSVVIGMKHGEFRQKCRQLVRMQLERSKSHPLILFSMRPLEIDVDDIVQILQNRRIRAFYYHGKTTAALYTAFSEWRDRSDLETLVCHARPGPGMVDIEHLPSTFLRTGVPRLSHVVIEGLNVSELDFDQYEQVHTLGLKSLTDSPHTNLWRLTPMSLTSLSQIVAVPSRLVSLTLSFCVWMRPSPGTQPIILPHLEYLELQAGVEEILRLFKWLQIPQTCSRKFHVNAGAYITSMYSQMEPVLGIDRSNSYTTLTLGTWYSLEDFYAYRQGPYWRLGRSNGSQFLQLGSFIVEDSIDYHLDGEDIFREEFGSILPMWDIEAKFTQRNSRNLFTQLPLNASLADITTLKLEPLGFLELSDCSEWRDFLVQLPSLKSLTIEDTNYRAVNAVLEFEAWRVERNRPEGMLLPALTDLELVECDFHQCEGDEEHEFDEERQSILMPVFRKWLLSRYNQNAGLHSLTLTNCRGLTAATVDALRWTVAHVIWDGVEVYTLDTECDSDYEMNEDDVSSTDSESDAAISEVIVPDYWWA